MKLAWKHIGSSDLRVPSWLKTVLRAGLLGLAYFLAEKALFRTQIIAILRAAHLRNVKLMFPMVMGVADMKEARA